MFAEDKIKSIISRYPYYVDNLCGSVPRNVRKLIMTSSTLSKNFGVFLILDLDHKDQYSVVARNPNTIILMDNPCPEAQLCSILHDINIVLYIKNPCQQVLDKVKQKNQILFECLKIIAGKKDEYFENEINELNGLSRVTRLREISKNGSIIKFMKNPSEVEQLASVASNPLNVIYIENPTITVQKFVIEQNPYYLRLIKNPHEDIQQLAIHECPHLMVTISNPSIKLQLAAVSSWGPIIKFINNPSNCVKYAAMNKCPESITFINNRTLADEMYALGKGNSLANFQCPSDELVLCAIYKNPENIEFVENIPINILNTIIRRDPKLAQLTEKVSLKIQKYIIDQDIQNIKFIKNLHDDIQIKVLEKNFGYFLKYFKKPTQKTLDYTKTKFPDLFEIITNKCPRKRKELYHYFIIKSSFPPDFKCTICFVETDYVDYVDLGHEYYTLHTTQCKHTFHKPCINEWSQNHNNCPLCRAQF